MGSKTKYVQAPYDPQIDPVRSALSSWMQSYGTQNRGTYPWQNPYLNYAGSMLQGMAAAGQPAGLGASNSVLAQLLGLNQTPAMYNPQTFWGMNNMWPNMAGQQRPVMNRDAWNMFPNATIAMGPRNVMLLPSSRFQMSRDDDGGDMGRTIGR